MGKYVKAAKVCINSKSSVVSYAKKNSLNIDSLRSALRRLNYRVMSHKINRRLMLHKGLYYYRLRTNKINAFIKLSNDLSVARVMRDDYDKKFRMNPFNLKT